MKSYLGVAADVQNGRAKPGRRSSRERGQGEAAMPRREEAGSLHQSGSSLCFKGCRFTWPREICMNCGELCATLKRALPVLSSSRNRERLSRIHAVRSNARPHPYPLPQERETSMVAPGNVTKRWTFSSAGKSSPSPWGRGRGEGELEFQLNSSG